MMRPVRSTTRRLWTDQALAGTAITSAVIPLALAASETRDGNLRAAVHFDLATAGTTDDVLCKIFPVFRRGDADVNAALLDTQPVATIALPVATGGGSPQRRTVVVDWSEVGDAFIVQLSRIGSTDTFTVNAWVSFYCLK